MKKSILILVALLLFLPSLAAAAPPITSFTTQDTGLTIASNIPHYVAQNQVREWEIHVLNGTELIQSGVTCNLHIYNEWGNGGHAYSNTSSTVDGYDIELISPASAHATKGEYSFKAFCNTSGQAGIYEEDYFVTANGYPVADDPFKIFIFLMFLVSIIGSLAVMLLTISKIATTSATIYDILLAWSSFIVLLVTDYLARNYLLTTYIETVTGAILTPVGLVNVILPVVAVVITIVYRGTKKGKNLTEKELNGRLG